MDDAAAIGSADSEGVEALILRTAPGLERFFARRTGSADEAQDLVQEAWLRLWRSGRAGALDNAEAFLQSIARNLLRDRARRRAARLADAHVALGAADNIAAPDPGPAEILELREAVMRYQRAVDGLRPRTRHIFLRHRLDGLSYRAIAAELGLSVSAVEKHMMKAILRLDRAVSR